jgi:putative exosortase-associated protein (TIGR04073 family)
MMRPDLAAQPARRIRVSAAVTTCAAIFFATCLLFAADSTSAREYTAGHKFRRGVSNLTLGVLAIPGQMTVKSREDGYAIGLPLGFVQGLGWFVTTELVGVWEFLTCPFEFPPKFRPIIEPEYPWDYFERRNRGAGVL